MKEQKQNLAKDLAAQIPKPSKPISNRPHHSGKGTPARINTAAEKHFFGSKYST